MQEFHKYQTYHRTEIKLPEGGEHALIATIQKELSDTQEVKAGQKIAEETSEAWGLLFKYHSRFIAGIALKFSKIGEPEFHDYMQVGSIGLLRAAIKYDFNSGNKFLTYAEFWIKQAMYRYEKNNTGALKFPSVLLEEIRKINAIKKEHLLLTGKKPTEEEILSKLPKHMKLNKELLKKRKKVKVRALSLNDYVLNDPSFAEYIENIQDNQDIEEAVHIYEYIKAIRRIMPLLDNIDPRMSTILTMRFGLNGGEEMTLSEIGKELGYSRELIRLVQNETFRIINAFLDIEL